MPDTLPITTRSLPPDIMRVVRAMCRERAWLGTRSGAFRNCYNASLDLTRRLQKAGRRTRIMPVRVPALASCHPHWKIFRNREHCITHYAVNWRGFIIDLTARQFDNNAPFPRIFRCD